VKLLTTFTAHGGLDLNYVTDESNVRKHCANKGKTLPGDIEIKAMFHTEADVPDHWCVEIYEVNNRGG
jgi:hypothetical protein